MTEVREENPLSMCCTVQSHFLEIVMKVGAVANQMTIVL